jgi:hypothetical protein
VRRGLRGTSGLVLAGLAFLTLAGRGEARPVPEPVRDQVFQASVELGVGVLNQVEGAFVDVEVTDRYTRCPRPKRGLYACPLTVRTMSDGEAARCRAVVAASRKGWRWHAFECPAAWRS